jgi:hypothetical protein
LNTTMASRKTSLLPALTQRCGRAHVCQSMVEQRSNSRSRRHPRGDAKVPSNSSADPP